MTGFTFAYLSAGNQPGFPDSEVPLRRPFFAVAIATGALTIPAAAAESSPNVPLVTGHSAVTAKQAANYVPVQTAHLRHKRLRQRKRFTHIALSPVLGQIAACESGGNPQAIGGGGAFRGKYQFDYGTWESVGGQGDPAAAPEAEQDMRAQMLLNRSGTSPWPVCG